ncbi:hypothetical protein L1765_01060 [Microaerobacter geothermalis]|uniref:hypothetical protein n=1 Tax=Microaerobacter geothermalis TaxID=674972 RepID=UPI001F33C644|nr:hypothetical protein [Microaerobacter geothermalis]MCF6092582.1 hypothetical protein [Microaerobacter geothermalis]
MGYNVKQYPSNQWNRQNIWIPLLLVLVGMIFFSGCSYESGPKTFDDAVEKIPGQPMANGKELLGKAIAAMESKETVKFWYTGYVANNIQKRRTTSMYDGVVIRPNGYLVNARMAGQPFRYYRWDDKVYLKLGNTWYPAEEPYLPMDPFKGFSFWEYYIDQAVQLPDAEVLGEKTRVVRLELKGKQLYDLAVQFLEDHTYFPIEDTEDLRDTLDRTTVTTTFWISKETYRIVQYQTRINLPIPGAGYMDQEIFFRLYRFNDSGIKMASPEDIEKYAFKPDEMESKSDENSP